MATTETRTVVILPRPGLTRGARLHLQVTSGSDLPSDGSRPTSESFLLFHICFRASLKAAQLRAPLGPSSQSVLMGRMAWHAMAGSRQGKALGQVGKGQSSQGLPLEPDR
jgi:hypothetical protein